MLKSEEIELVHGEVDGTNAPAETAAAKALMEREPEAAALAADLQRMSAMLDQVGDQAPSPHLRAAILASVPVRARAAERSMALLPRLRAYVQDTARHLNAATPAKKLRLVGMAAVAIVVIVGGSLVDFAPSGAEVGTIGGESMGGIQRASRYRGRTMTDGDITIGDAEIAVLLQNPQVQLLLRNDAVRNALSNDAVRNALSNDAVRNALSNDAVRNALSNDAVRNALSNDALMNSLSNDAVRNALSNALSNGLNSIIVPKNDALGNALNNDALLNALSNDAVRNALSNDALLNALSNDAVRNALSNDAVRNALSNNALLNALSNDAVRNALSNALSNDGVRNALNNDALRNSLSNSLNSIIVPK